MVLAQSLPPPEWATPRPNAARIRLAGTESLSNTRWQTIVIGISPPGASELWITRENVIQTPTLSSLRLGFGGLTYPDLITRVQAWAEPMDGEITWTVETTGVVFYGVQFTHTLFASWATTVYARYDSPEYIVTFGVIGGPGFEYGIGSYVKIPNVYTITYARVFSAYPDVADPFPIYTPDGAYWPVIRMHPPSESRAWITYALRIGDLREDTANPRPDLIWLTPSLQLVEGGQVRIRAEIRNNGSVKIPERIGGFLAALYRRLPDDPPAGPLDGRGWVAWMRGSLGDWLPPMDPGAQLPVSATTGLEAGKCFFLYVDVDPYYETTVGRVWESNEANNVVRICPPTVYLPLVLRNSP
ncbi:hypothetical protein [Thermoflexus sp.]|uniref:hypothetical protein n=1 Tax=Thermoflexus sp. TaxID=1969742 RepID=UPI0025D321E0|nr:hypothetical protein [Thermoflexus sp.]MCS6964069.1 hypothetical protein [Thermoflexus sp.]MCX7691687.1 hypothetical protein [Thermoflexus sp.]MDW8065958.1 hypothetical protein [Anaerolineae bacterium]MDW8183868.1 hypothetical protein [Anaerolineae bacterium]